MDYHFIKPLSETVRIEGHERRISSTGRSILVNMNAASIITVSLVCVLLASCEPADYIGFVPSGAFELKCPGASERLKVEEAGVENIRVWFQENQDGWQVSHDTFAASHALHGQDFELIILKDGYVLKRGVRQHAKSVNTGSRLPELCI